MAPWVAITISCLAFFFSFYQYWRANLSPYSLLIIPPAVTQVNDELPSLIIDIALTNNGGDNVVLTDLAIRGFSASKQVPVILHAQKTLNRESKYSALPLDSTETKSSVFLPVLLKNKESTALRLYCAPFASELPLSEAAVLSIDNISIDLSVNGEYKPSVFMLSYPDYQDKFKGKGIIEIPKTGFSPRWYREEKPVRLRAS